MKMAGAAHRTTVALAAVLIATAGACRGNPVEGYDEAQLIERLSAAGLSLERREPTAITVRELELLPAEPISMFSARVSDGAGNSQTMTFLQFESFAVADQADRENLNGFAAANWFVLGIVSSDFVDRIRGALP